MTERDVRPLFPSGYYHSSFLIPHPYKNSLPPLQFRFNRLYLFLLLLNHRLLFLH